MTQNRNLAVGAALSLTDNGATSTVVIGSVAHTGDVTSAANSNALTMATVNANVGTIGDASHVAQVTLDAKGRVTAATAVAITPAAIGAPSGSGTSTGTNTGDQTTVSGNSGGVTGITFPGSGLVVGTTDTQELSNKRIDKRVLALSANSATPAINTDNYDVVHITAQTAAITSFTTNLSGTPKDGDTLRISVTGTAAVALTFGASFEASTVALPSTTVGTTRLDMGFFWNTETMKWRVVGLS